jgi:ion channel-forming bestrophin family protein
MERRDFWVEVFTFHGSVTPKVKSRVLLFGLFALLVAAAVHHWAIVTGLAVAPYEIVGVILALLLVLRTNSGYDRWYEGRKLWGGIVNQCRNLTLIGLSHGPKDLQWREQFVRWTAAFPHACRHSLRSERDLRDMEHILGKEATAQLAVAEHMPMFVARQLARMLREAIDSGTMDRFALIQAENERSQLIDHIGACERILKTPLATVFSIKIRRFLFIYLLALPFGLVDKTGLLSPVITMLVAYPLLALDEIGVELQNPFCRTRLSHLPLGDICTNIERNLLAALEDAKSGRPAEIALMRSEASELPVSPHAPAPIATGLPTTSYEEVGSR